MEPDEPLLLLLRPGADVVDAGFIVDVLSSVASSAGRVGSSLSVSAAGGVSMGEGSSCMREIRVSWELLRFTDRASVSILRLSTLDRQGQYGRITLVPSNGCAVAMASVEGG